MDARSQASESLQGERLACVELGSCERLLRALSSASRARCACVLTCCEREQMKAAAVDKSTKTS